MRSLYSPYLYGVLPINEVGYVALRVKSPSHCATKAARRAFRSDCLTTHRRDLTSCRREYMTNQLDLSISGWVARTPITGRDGTGRLGVSTQVR